MGLDSFGERGDPYRGGGVPHTAELAGRMTRGGFGGCGERGFDERGNTNWAAPARVEPAMRVANWAPAHALSGMAFFPPSFLPSITSSICIGSIGGIWERKKKLTEKKKNTT
jgi:hypothetical protein